MSETLCLGKKREVLWDDYLVDPGMTSAFPRLQQPVLKGKCFMFDQGWELSTISFPCVVKDDVGYKMYYMPYNPDVKEEQVYLAVLESQDGVNWIRPKLDIYKRPDLEINNVVIDKLEDGCFVFYDTNPNCDPLEKYKALTVKKLYAGAGRVTEGLWCYTSADGYHFKSSHLITIEGIFDSLNTAFWADGKYVCYFRDYHYATEDSYTETTKPDNGKKGTQWEAENNLIRDIRVIYSDDFKNWTKPQMIRFEDGLDYPLYVNNVITYPRAPHIFIGFPVRYCERKEWTHNIDQLGCSMLKKSEIDNREKRMGLAVTDGIFMCSRDGELWHRFNEAFLAPGYEGGDNWVYGDCYAAYNLIDSNRETYYMYTIDWHRSYGSPKPMSRYEIRKDGFACYMADGEERILVTKPLTFEGSILHLNFQTSAYGYIYVDILDEKGNTLSQTESFEVYGDNIDRGVCFSDGSDFSEYVGCTVRLRFRMRDAKLFSVWFE